MCVCVSMGEAQLFLCLVHIEFVAINRGTERDNWYYL